jgi:ElaB/YqjD/DUF883 family membrane-anchored ribosome-binding protein
MNHRTDTNSQTPEQLIKNIQQLMEEVETVISKSSDSATSGFTDKLGELQDRFNGAKTKAAGYYKAARQKVVDGASAADDTIRSHPYESLAVALGVGVLLGAVLRRRD